MQTDINTPSKHYNYVSQYYRSSVCLRSLCVWRRSGRGGSELDRHRLMFRTGVRPWLELPSGSSETSIGNCRETGTGRVRACHTPRHPLQNHPSGHLGRWATPWPAEEMLDGQRQRADSPARARAAHKGLLQKRPEEHLCLIVPPVP